jgi:two-component system sensor histidine kinase DesK
MIPVSPGRTVTAMADADGSPAESCGPGSSRRSPRSLLDAGVWPMALGAGGIGVLLLLPMVVDAAEAGTATAVLALLGVVGGAVLALVVPATRARHRPVWLGLGLVVLLVLAAVTSRELGAAWHNVWLLLAIAVGSLAGQGVVTVPRALAGVGAVTVVSGVVVAGSAQNSDDVWAVVLTAFLAGASTLVLVQLLSTITELRITRQELARRAVAEERERFSRDLHDLLGHTLSVVVVKAEAVRRLVSTDPDAAAQHAQDIETIGRRALTEIREAVTGSHRASLAAEIVRGRAALESAGIDATLTPPSTLLPEPVDEAFAWVVREGVTNVIKHSGAHRCGLVVGMRDGTATLELFDDGARPETQDHDGNGLAGLRDRLAKVDGRLVTDREADGFRLLATVPAKAELAR